MQLSEAAQFFIGRCFNKGIVMSIAPLFNEKYGQIVGGVKYKFTTEILDEMLQSGCVTVKYRNDKMADITGIEGTNGKEKAQEEIL